MSVRISCWLFGIALFAGNILAAQPAVRAASNTTPQQVFDGMRETFRADKAKGLHAVYQFNLSGPHGGEWWMEVREGKLIMGRGKVAKPDVTFAATDADWVALSNGTLQGWWAHLSGRLKIHGSQALARKLDEICP